MKKDTINIDEQLERLKQTVFKSDMLIAHLEDEVKRKDEKLNQKDLEIINLKEQITELKTLIKAVGAEKLNEGPVSP